MGMGAQLDDMIRMQLEAERKEVERLIIELAKKKESIIDALIELSRN